MKQESSGGGSAPESPKVEKKVKPAAPETLAEKPGVPAFRPPDVRRMTESPAAQGRTTPQYPCLCPGEKYPITRSVCLGRQERNYERCLKCEYAIRDRRPRKSDFKDK